MAGNAPARALGTRRGVEIKQNPLILRHRTPFGTPTLRTTPSQACIAWLGVYARTVEMAQLLLAVQP